MNLHNFILSALAAMLVIYFALQLVVWISRGQ